MVVLCQVQEWEDPSGALQSKVNRHEVALTTAIARYLIQQGYDPSDLVVLTPYLGQLLELQRSLSKDFAVLVDALDLNDLRKNNMDVPPPATGRAQDGKQGEEGSVTSDKEDELDMNQKAGIRVATIDNYQASMRLIASEGRPLCC